LARVIHLSCTATDMSPMAKSLGHAGPPFRWDARERDELMAELDAALFHLYGIDRNDVDYIMDTFPIVKRKDIAKHEEYRTKRRILEIFDAMAEAERTGEPYKSPFDAKGRNH